MTTIPLKNTWSWLVTDLASHGVTLLNRLATNLAITYTLNAPAVMTCDVPSDNPEINILRSDGDPFVSFNDRLLYGFRRENGTPPWTCRFAGVLQIIEDEATSDEPVSHLTAYDPWMWLNSIPVVDSIGDLLGQNGLTYTAQHGNVIALDLLLNALTAVLHLNPTNPSYIDYLSGHFDTTDAIDINFAQGISVGEAWTQLVDTGSMDIVLTPIYDPTVRPGKLCTLNIYSLAGAVRNNAIFAWDKFPRSLVGISRLLDGTQMANVAQYYLGGSVVTQAQNAASIAKYGQYWLQRSYPKPAVSDAVALIAAAQVALLRKGKRTLTIDPAPERSPDPFTDYYLGDQVMVYAGRTTVGGGVSFRQTLNAGTVSAGAWTNPQRIYQLPISLADDLVETVEQLLLTDTNA